MKEKFKFKNLLNGILLGASNIIPGVSGGTTAVMLGIYEKLIASIEGLGKDFKKNILYLIQIGIGVLIGVVGFSGIISYLLGKYTIALNYLFIGLVLGSLKIITKSIENKKISIGKIFGFIIGICLVLSISIIGGGIDKANEVTVATGSNSSYLPLIFAGFVTAFTMILPGVSGSLTLVMLGLYDVFINAIATFNIPYLLAGALGGLIGLVTTVKLISYLLKNFNDIVYSAIIGLVFGSVVVIIMANPVSNNWFVALISIFIGTLITLIFLKNNIKNGAKYFSSI